jgi:MYXO-CTERM domain-containing protein
MFGALALALAAGLASAATHTIDFDTDANGNAIASGSTLTNQYAAWGVSFMPNALDPVNGWATNTDMTITSTDTGGGYVASYGNILHSFGGWLSEDGDANFAMMFDTPITDITVRFTGDADFVSLVALFDTQGNLVAEALATGTGTLSSVTFSGLSNTDLAIVAPGYYFDWAGVVDITFTTVPAPASLGLVGLAGLTMARRRR